MEQGSSGPPWNLRPEGSDLSNFSSTTLGGSGPSSPYASFGRRPRYQRLGSEGTPEQSYQEEQNEEEEGDISRAVRHAGLGIQHVARERSISPEVTAEPIHARRVSIQRVSNPSIRQAYASPKTDSAPGSSNPLISPPLGDTSHLSSTRTAYDPSANPYIEEEDEIARSKRRSNVSSSNYPYVYDDTVRLNRPKSNYSIRSAFETHDFNPHACPTANPFYQGRFNWLAVSIVLIALFSTVFSGIFFGIAVRGPRWGTAIRSRGGSLNPAGADILTQVFAKLIELSFVTVFVAFLGQVLSRRAFNSSAKGVTIAEITMRNWVMQPGSMITHYETVRYAALSFLGILSLAVAAFAMIYSTASTALVTPQLKFGDWDSRVMGSLVKASFSNINNLRKNCRSPIRLTSNTNYSLDLVGNTCLEIDHAAQGYHNYMQYMTAWAGLVETGGANNVDQKGRPPGFALHNETIAVNASWIEVIDTAEASKKFNRTINNVTLAMPHTGVVAAGIDPSNGILQPTDLNGEGIYNIRASVPSPYINVLCANLERSEYADFVYETMPNVTLNVTADFGALSTQWFVNGVDWDRFYSFNISTDPNSLDAAFGWTSPRHRPAFYKWPIDFNTVLNGTRSIYNDRDSLYLLGTGDTSLGFGHFMCKVKAGLTPKCSTQFQATSRGGSMRAHCEDDKDTMQFLRGNTSREATTSLDWFDVGSSALTSLSLGTGVTDSAASNARLLTQLALGSPELNPALPSPAEALAVLAGCTLLMGVADTPFVEFWNYTIPELEIGAYQYFNANVQAQEYASGGTADYQKGFHVVLFSVFALNVFMLGYFIINKGLVTDFSEPPNLFSLAVNSPPSNLLVGSCGAGPVGDQFKVPWGIGTEGEHLFMTDRKDTEPKIGGGQATTTGYSSVAADGGAHDHAHQSQGITRGNTFEMGSMPPTPSTPGTPGVNRSKSKFGRHLHMLTNKRKSFL